MSNLWVENIKEGLVDAPVTILQNYANQIKQDLNNQITAEVNRQNYGNFNDLTDDISKLTGKVRPKTNPKFYYTFEIVAPALAHYRYELFVVSFDIQMYPVKLYLDEDVLHEIAPDLEDEHYGPLTVNEPAEMETILKSIFNATKTITVIRSLLSLMNEPRVNGTQH